MYIYHMIGGSSTRWNNHSGIENKHDIIIGEETLFNRTLRLAKEFCCPHKLVNSPTPRGVLTPTIYPEFARNACHYGYVCIMPGDVYFSTDTFRRIQLFHDQGAAIFFGKKQSPIKGYPEIYTVKISYAVVYLVEKIVHSLKGEIKFHSLYRALPPDRRVWVEVDGETEDFDFPHDYDNYVKRYHA